MESSQINNHQNESKILHLSSWYPSDEYPYLGNFVESYIKGQNGKHHNTLIVRYIKKSHNSFSILSPTKSNFLSWLLYVRKQLRQQPYDLVHLHVSIDLWFLGYFLRFWCKKPVILTEHGSYFEKEKFEDLPIYKKHGIRSLLKKVDRLVCVSEALAQDIKLQTKRSLMIIGNFIPDKWILENLKDRKVDSYRFLHVSTLESLKNPTGILNAALMCRQAGFENFELVFVGEKRNTEVEHFIEVMRMDSFVRLKGPLTHEEVLEEYQQAHCFILNSNYETFSIVALEALALGLQLISTPVGFPRNLSSEAIELVEFNDAEMLSTRMMKCISKQIFPGETARKEVTKFTQSEINASYNRLYEELIHG